MIGSTASIMNKFVLKLRNHCEADIERITINDEELGIFGRNFTSIHVDMDGSEGFDKVAKLLIHFGPYLRDLKFFCPNTSITIESSYFKEILEKMPVLKILDLHRVKITLEIKEKSISMPQLEDLKIGSSNKCLIEMISAPKLKSFNNLSIESFDTTKICSILENSIPPLLFPYKTLEFFIVPLRFYYHCTRNNEPVAALRLERLDVSHDFKVTNKASLEKFHKFLQSQAVSLTNFIFRSMTEQFNSRGLYKIIFGELKALRVLTIDFSLLPAEQEFYNQLKALTFLRKINVVGSFQSKAAAKAFLKLCPKVTCLCAMEDVILPTLLGFLSINSLDIERMLLKTISHGNIPRMPALKRLEVMRRSDCCKMFKTVNPHVELVEILQQRR